MKIAKFLDWNVVFLFRWCPGLPPLCLQEGRWNLWAHRGDLQPREEWLCRCQVPQRATWVSQHTQTDKAVKTGMQVLRGPLVAKHYQARWKRERNLHVKCLNHVNMPKHTSSTTVRWCVKSWPLPLFPPFMFLDGQYQKCMALESCEMLKMNAYIDMKCCSDDMCNTFDNSI